MGIERSEPTKEQKDHLVKAIERNNTAAVSMLLRRFGHEVWLEHRRYEKRKDGTVVHTLSGTPLSIAAHLKKDELAVSLLTQGAGRETSYWSFGCVDEDAAGEVDQSTVTLMEHAIDNRLPLLTRALMERSPGFDWNHKNAVTLRWAGSFIDNTLFDKYRTFEDTLAFLGDVGLFVGKVGQSQVKVAAQGARFEARVDDQVIGHYPTMADSIAAIAATLGLPAITPVPPPAPAAPLSKAELEALDRADDIPY